MAFAVVTFVLGFSRGPLQGTKVDGRRGWFVFTVGIFFALLTPGLVFVAIWKRTWCGYGIACSLIVPPLCFFLEYVYLVDHTVLRQEKNLFDALKHAQDVCAKVWIWVVGLLYLIYRAVHGGS